jgi:Uma2 family endonuclease
MRSPLPIFTVEEYLHAEANSPTRHEYMGGYAFAMAGASEEHNIIAGNLYSLLRPHLRGSSCRVFMSDMKVKVQDDIFYYPDLLVTCNREDNHRYFKTQPNLSIFNCFFIRLSMSYRLHHIFKLREKTTKHSSSCDH